MRSARSKCRRIAPDLPIAQIGRDWWPTWPAPARPTWRCACARPKAVVDTLATVETSMMPFPDDQPVVYPDAAVWEELTARRKKYTYTDLKKVGAGRKEDSRGT